MRHFPPRSFLFGLLTFIFFSNLYGAPSWNLLGLADRTINCILADDSTMILAGTSKGMSVYWNNNWYDFSLNLPVVSIVRLTTDYIAI